MSSGKKYTLNLPNQTAHKRKIDAATVTASDEQLALARRAYMSLRKSMSEDETKQFLEGLHAKFEHHVSAPLQRKVEKCLRENDFDDLVATFEDQLQSQAGTAFPKTDSLGDLVQKLCSKLDLEVSAIENTLKDHRRLHQSSDFASMNLKPYINLWLAILAWNAICKGWIICFAEDKNRIAWLEPNGFPKMPWPMVHQLPSDAKEFPITSWDDRICRHANANRLLFVSVLDLAEWKIKQRAKRGPRNKEDRELEKWASGCIGNLAESDPTRRLRKEDALNALKSFGFPEAAALRIWSSGAPDAWRKSGAFADSQNRFSSEDLTKILQSRLK